MEKHFTDYLVENPSKIKDGSHIVLFANWSPCSACTKDLKHRAEVILHKRPNCRFRFRFRNYYSKDKWEATYGKIDEKNFKGTTLFKTELIARRFYDPIELQFGYFPEKSHDGVVSKSPRVAFLQGNRHSRHILDVTTTTPSTST
jgi:hypothetical protein